MFTEQTTMGADSMKPLIPCWASLIIGAFFEASGTLSGNRERHSDYSFCLCTTNITNYHPPVNTFRKKK